MQKKKDILNVYDYSFFSSSAEFMDKFWLRKVAKLMIKCDGNGFHVLETAGQPHLK
jgi:hypothetical protein